ncbi:hypothetical protein [Chenggangzhangella methanolivorans]|uniref:DUF4148 domain-containing protein n=1 Tax=Chenggangzhangella methanolivorans TaxID=1437009 RepID=A0A9E6UHZ3_9HYPH|nr:hypothetical protein [Chenggangzhangella methanolivorans]QZO00258.1 hypothetical protein K6K41_00100 [Chenggangzhangella methanolivorans]
MKSIVYGLAALAVASTAAVADPVTPATITGYSASVAVARGVPLDGSANASLDRRAPQFRQSAADDATAGRRVLRVSNERTVSAR